MLFSASSCRRCTDECDPNCKNYDPCCGQIPPNASFKIYEVLQNNPSIQYQGYEPEDVATDTIVFINTARFYADNEADYYEWSIDGDNRTWNTREFFLNFGNLPFYQPAEVTLKVYRDFDKSCHPNAQDTAEFKRTLYTVPFDSSRVYGYYDGYLQSNTNTPTYFEIFPWKNMFGGKEDSINGVFLKCSDGTDFGLDSWMGYKSYFISTQKRGSGCCYGLSGFGMLTSTTELKMIIGHFPVDPIDTCSWNPLQDSYVKDIFYGIKEE